MKYSNCPCEGILLGGGREKHALTGRALTADIAVMYADVESSAVCIGKERGLPSIEAECSLLGQPPSPANASGLPEGLTGDTVEQVVTLVITLRASQKYQEI